MPVYLIHGFRWPRANIRIHIILQNLDDAAAEWLVAPATTATMLKNFHDRFPSCMQHLPDLRFIEQYDPDDLSVATQPYAYVADVCEEIKLGIDIDEVRGKGVPNDQWAAMIELRDQIAQDQKVAWYVVVCGDTDRWAPGMTSSSASIPRGGSTDASQNGDGSEASFEHHSLGEEDAGTQQIAADKPQQGEPRGLRKLFSAIGKQTSRLNLGTGKSSGSPTSSNTSPTNARAEQVRPKSSKAVSNNTLSQGVTTYAAFARSTPSFRFLHDDHEIITGPTYDDSDDDLAAPAPTIKQGKEHELANKQRKRSSVSSFTSIKRGTTPDALRHARPSTRSKEEPATTSSSLTEPFSQHVTRLQQELMRDDIEEEPRPQRAASPPISYKPTGIPQSGITSMRTSRSNSPAAAPTVRQPSTTRLAALAALEGEPPLPVKTAKPSRSRQLIVNNGNIAQASQYSLSSMSGTVTGLYAAHDREYNRNRQSVTREDLVARGLENMDFSALR